MAFTTLDKKENQGKTGLENLIPAVDANFTAIGQYNPGIVTVTAVDGEDGTAAVTLQVQDANGNEVSARAQLSVWIAGTAFAAPSATGVTAFAVDTGVELEELTDGADYRILTDATGEAAFTLTAANGTYHAMAEANGLVYSGAVVITGN